MRLRCKMSDKSPGQGYRYVHHSVQLCTNFQKKIILKHSDIILTKKCTLYGRKNSGSAVPGVRLNVEKCKAMHFGRKNLKTVYSMNESCGSQSTL